MTELEQLRKYAENAVKLGQALADAVQEFRNPPPSPFTHKRKIMGSKIKPGSFDCYAAAHPGRADVRDPRA
jgi:hypothetical protein